MKLVGQGTFGSVVKAFCYKTKKTVAIKRISDFDKWEYLTVQVLREVSLMKELSVKHGGSNHVPIIYDVFAHEEKGKEPESKNLTVYIVMEYFKTDLNKFMKKQISSMDEKKVLQMIKEFL